MPHRVVLAGVLALLSAALLAQPAPAGRGLEVQVRESSEPDAGVAKSVKLYDNSHALVVGIDDYARWPDLAMAVTDAKRVAAALREKGFSVTTLFNPDAGELRAALRRFFARKGDDPDARLMLWYAGHGHTLDGQGFLVPADAPDPGADSTGFKIRALAMRQFGSLVRLADSKHVLGVFDSCFSGTIFRTRSRRAPEAITEKTVEPVRQFITAGMAGQTVRDDGTFRKLFLRAIRGDARADANDDGYVTGAELGLYLNQEMAALTNNAQTPRGGKLQDADYNQGDFVFSLGRGEAGESEGTDGGTDSSGTAGGKSPEIVFWRSIKDSDDPADFKAYLNQVEQGRFDGVFAALARNRLDALEGETRTAKQTSGEAAEADSATDDPDHSIAERDQPYVITTRSNVRAGPGTDHARLATLDKGTEVTATGKVKAEPWFRIGYANGQTGFIHGDLIRKRPKVAGKPIDGPRTSKATTAESKTAERQASNIASRDMTIVAKAGAKVFSEPADSAPTLAGLDQGRRIDVTGRVEGQPWYRVAVG